MHHEGTSEQAVEGKFSWLKIAEQMHARYDELLSA